MAMIWILKKLRLKSRSRKILKKIFILLFVFSIFSMLLFLIYRGLSRISFNFKRSFVSANVVVECENLADIKYSDKLLSWARENLTSEKLNSIDFQDLYKNLKTNFAFVNRLECDFLRHDISRIKIYALSPMFLINNSYVLSYKKRLFHADIFKEHSLDRLKKVFVPLLADQEKIDNDFYNFIFSIPSKIFASHELHYKNSYLIILKSKNIANRYKLIIDKDSIFDEKKFAHIDSVLAKLQTTNLKFKKSGANKNFEWALDLRFKNRIIVRNSEDFKE